MSFTARRWLLRTKDEEAVAMFADERKRLKEVRNDPSGTSSVGPSFSAKER